MTTTDPAAKKAALAMGARLRAARVEAGYVESETGRKNGGVTRLAKDAGVSPSDISKIEKGDRTIDRVGRDILAKLGEKVGKHPEWIRTGKEPDTAHDLLAFVTHHVRDAEIRAEVLRAPYAFDLHEIKAASEQRNVEVKMTARQRLLHARETLAQKPLDTDPAGHTRAEGLTKSPKKRKP